MIAAHQLETKDRNASRRLRLASCAFFIVVAGFVGAHLFLFNRFLLHWSLRAGMVTVAVAGVGLLVIVAHLGLLAVLLRSLKSRLRRPAPR
jgi:hypothetical protein